MPEEKLFSCVKCKKDVKESEGVMIWNGTAFCCHECKKKIDEEKDHSHEESKDVCEFC